MRRRSSLLMIAGIIGLCLLAGCGNSSDKDGGLSAGISTDPAADDKSRTGTGDDDANEETEADISIHVENLYDDAAGPSFFITENTKQKELDGMVVVDHRYDTIGIDNAGDKYKDLSVSLEALNKDIERREDEAMEINIDEITDHDETVLNKMQDSGYFPHEERWRIYVRRCDENIFSVASEYRIIGDEGDHVEMRGHTYLADSGRELQLSDIVADENALYDLLAEFLSYSLTKKMMIFAGDNDMELIECKEAMEECFESDRAGWVLDPQGLTFWFEDINAAIHNKTVSVLFADDEEGKIFKKEFVDNAPSEWIMQLPGDYIDTQFDTEDDGFTDTISWLVSYMTDDKGSSYPAGMNVNYNGYYYDASELYAKCAGEWTDNRAMLAHRDGRTVLMAYFVENGVPTLDTYVLTADSIAKADTKNVWLGTVPADEKSAKYRIPVDVSAITGLPYDQSFGPELFSITGEGMFKEAR